MQTTTSADGTTIAYEAYGDGPLAIVVGGAFNDRGAWTELAEALAERGLTGVTYDRRGRGDSSDTQPFAVEREIEDIAALIAAAGPSGPTAPAYLHGVSSGGALVLRALAAGLPVARGSVLEPPYRTGDAPPPPERYIATLQEMIDADDRVGLLEYFHTRVVGMPIELLDPMRGTPTFDALLAMAPTISYDGQALGGDDHSLPVDLLADIETPVLAIASSGTALPWLAAAPSAVAAALPHGRAVTLEGGFHEVPVATLAPALAQFYTSAG
jgi:alpha-beta hydrolase superfamily lysophospholipase